MKIAGPLVVVDHCEKAAKFYRDLLGGEIKILNEQAGKVTAARLQFESTFIQFGDSMGKPVAKGENNRIYLQFDSEEEIRKVYDELKIDGTVNFELQKSPFAALYAVLTDKNSINWNLVCFTAN